MADRRKNQQIEQTVADFEEGQPVIYVPSYAKGDIFHKDCEYGIVGSKTEQTVFVKLYQQLRHLGWDDTTGKGCRPSDLRKIPLKEVSGVVDIDSDDLKAAMKEFRMLTKYRK